MNKTSSIFRRLTIFDIVKMKFVTQFLCCDGKKADIGDISEWQDGLHQKIAEGEWKKLNDFPKGIIDEWLRFEEQMKTVTVMKNGEKIQKQIPLELTRNPTEQKLETLSYQEMSQNILLQISYLNSFDFRKAKLQDISDSLRIMGLVNACAFKGKRKKLTLTEKLLNDTIYAQKQMYLEKLVDYCLEKEIKVYITWENILFIENPVTGVQISFHGYNPRWNQDLEIVSDDYWTGVTHSYVYENLKQQKLYNPIVEQLENQLVCDSQSYHITIFDIISAKSYYNNGGTKMEYWLAWGDGDYEYIEFQNDAEAQLFWIENNNRGMPIMDIYHYNNDDDDDETKIHVAKPKGLRVWDRINHKYLPPIE